MQRLVWRPEARQDLKEIVTYIAARNVSAADRLERMIGAAAERIPDHPFMHRLGRVPGTREAIVHPNYLLIYQVTADEVAIVNVVHARQRYP